MNYRKLGTSGIFVSEIGLGASQLGSKKIPLQEAENIIHAALDHGINFIDTANVYQDGRSEICIGKALKGRRHDVILATKCGNPVGSNPNNSGTSRHHIMNEIEGSLHRLAYDHIDLFYMHCWDKNTPVEETLRALDDLIRMGKIRYIGASNYAAWQLASANLLAEVRGWTPFVVIQSLYNIIDRFPAQEILSYCAESGVGFIPYFPLARGFLTGKYHLGENLKSSGRYVNHFLNDRECCHTTRKLLQWAQSRNHTLNELAIAWLLKHPTICAVIPGATKTEQVLENIKSIDWKLSDAEFEDVEHLINN